MAKVSFQMSDVQHKEWFIATLLPHIQTLLMQQKLVLHTVDFEIAMKLESSWVRDTGSGMMQIQSQLANLMVNLQDIKRGKEFQKELWCTICITYGHHKWNFPVLMNYVVAGASNPLNTQGMPLCRIFQTRDHKSKECMYLQKIVRTPDSLYCKFCKSVGHDENLVVADQYYSATTGNQKSKRSLGGTMVYKV